MEATLFPEVVVDGEVVPRTAIAAEAQNHAAPKGKPGIAWRKAARALVMRALLLQEARRRGIEAEPKAVGPGRRETEEEALIRGLLEAAVAVAPPEEAEIRAVWARDPERYRSPGLREASHILLAADPRDEAAFAAARTRAEALIARLRDDPGAFGRLAKAESACGSAPSGGMLGQLRPGDVVPEVEAALDALSPGEIGPEPVASRFGWHVLRLDAAEDGRPLPYESVRPRLAAAMEKAAWARAARAFVDGLVAAADLQGVDLGRARAAGGLR